MADFALKFDGSQNYITLGTLGNFGSNLGNGFYCKFQINTTQTTQGIFGVSTSGGNNYLEIGFNTKHDWTVVTNGLAFYYKDNTGKILDGGCDAPTVSWNDGNTHTIIWTANFATNTITLSIDGTSQTITYDLQQTPNSFANLPYAFYVGARDASGTASFFLASTIDNFQIGTSSSVLYGFYQMNEGSGTTTADSSGNGNTATLEGSPLPSWVSGLDFGNFTGSITFSGNLNYNSK